MRSRVRRTARVGPLTQAKVTCSCGRHLPRAEDTPTTFQYASVSIHVMRLGAVSAAFTIVIGSTFLAVRPSAQRPRFDIVIANGRIVDGTGSPWFRGDIGIAGDRIAAIGALGEATAGTRVDATNLVVAPGFIDLLGQSEFN